MPDLSPYETPSLLECDKPRLWPISEERNHEEPTVRYGENQRKAKDKF